MPKRKRFFLIDVFPNIYVVLCKTHAPTQPTAQSAGKSFVATFAIGRVIVIIVIIVIVIVIIVIIIIIIDGELLSFSISQYHG